jgi:Cyclic-phosphate processing Receiver domain
MKIWLDDVRTPPDETWKWAQNAQEFSELLPEIYADEVTEISFDHDIASNDYFGNEITGYTCLCWIEKIAYNDPAFRVPKMHVHSANPVGRQRMQKLIDRLKETQ